MSSKLSVDVKHTDIVVPNTGMFSTSHDNMANHVGNMIAPIIGVSILLLALFALVAKMVKNHKEKKHHKFSIHAGRSAILRFSGLFVVILVAVFAVVKYNEKQGDGVYAFEFEPELSSELSITTEDINIDVELDDEPVFASTKSTVKVDTATTSGYTLMAYIDGDTTDLTNETNANATTKITGLETSYSQPLAENTWGVALSLPEDQDAPIFRGLLTGEENAMTIKVTGSAATSANDKTELYYATYVTPDLEEGTYTGATVNYIAIANVITDEDNITVKYHTFNHELGEENINTVVYAPSCEIAYIGGNCRDAYAGAATSFNAAEGDIDHLPIIATGLEGSLIPVTNNKGDVTRVEMDHQENNQYYAVVVIRGSFPTMAELAAKIEEIREAEGNIEDWIIDIIMGDISEFYVSEETFTILTLPLENAEFDDLTYKITPVFAEKPSGIETTETTVCFIADDSEAFSEVRPDYDTGAPTRMLELARPVTIPGADRLRVEITYDFPAESVGRMSLRVAGGSLAALSASADYWELYSTEERISGVDVFEFEGDTAMFIFYGQYLASAGSNYGFSAKVYPIYYDETEDTTPTQVCKLVNKSGTYREPEGFKPSGYWEVEFDTNGDGWIDYSGLVDNEEEVLNLLNSHYDMLRGQTVDAYEGYPSI